MVSSGDREEAWYWGQKVQKRFVKVLARRKKVNLVDPHSPAEKKILRRKAD